VRARGQQRTASDLTVPQRRCQRRRWRHQITRPHSRSLSVQDTHRTEVLQISRAQRMRHVWHGRNSKRWNKTSSSEAAQRRAGSHEPACKHSSFHLSPRLPACSPGQRRRLHRVRALRDCNPHGLKGHRRGGQQNGDVDITLHYLFPSSPSLLCWPCKFANASDACRRHRASLLTEDRCSLLLRTSHARDLASVVRVSPLFAHAPGDDVTVSPWADANGCIPPPSTPAGLARCWPLVRFLREAFAVPE
jgi:hypothetical protein